MPISSHQISGLIAGQQQSAMLGQQQAMMIGAPHPMFSGAPAPSMGMSQYPPQFGPPQPMTMPMAPSMAPMTSMGMAPMGAFSATPGFGYGVAQGPNIGSHLGAGFMGAMGAFGTGLGALTMGAGVAEMMGARNPLVRGLGFMDPMGAAFNVGGGAMGFGGRMGMGMAGRVGLGLAAGTGVGALAYAGTEAVRMAGGAAIGGFQQQQALNAQLGNMTFANPLAATGRGFDPGQQRTIGAGMRAFAASDPFTTMTDMNALMSQFTDMGMAQGVRDAEEFTNKFKKMAETVRSMAMAMGTSLQEAAGTFGQMRQAGFFTASEVMGNTTQMNMLRGMGMSTEQFTQMQMSGAGMARSQGMLGQAGSRGATEMTQRLMLGMNPQREQLLMDVTGAQDAAGGAAAMGQRLMGGSQQFLQSQMGRAMMAGLGEIDEEGRFTGRMDQGQMQKFLRGEIGGSDISKVGTQRLRGAAGESFVRQEQMIRQSAMAQQGDTNTAIMRMLEATAGGNEDTMRILAERFAGMDEMTFQFAKSLADKHEKNNQDLRQAANRERAGQAIQLEIARNRSLSGMGQRLRGGVQDIFTGTFGQIGADISQTTSQLSQDISDEVFGISRTGVTQEGLNQAAMSVMAGQSSGMSTGLVGSASDFAVGRMGVDRTLLGSVARSQGVETAAAVTQMARGGGVANVGEMLGLSEGRQQKLDKVANKLRGNTYLRGLISQAQKARRDGNTREVRRLRTQIDRIITSDPSMRDLGTEGGADSQDQAIKDTAAILGKLDGNQLVAEQFKDEASLASLDAFKDTKLSQIDMEQRAQDAFGSRLSLSRTAMLALKSLADPTAFVRTVFMGKGLGESTVQAIVTGGAGANVLAAVDSDDKRAALLDIRARADEKSGQERTDFLVNELQQLTGRTITGQDAEAAMKMMAAADRQGGLKELTSQAARNERERGSGTEAAEAALQAFSTTKIKGFDKELRAIRSGLAGGQLSGARAGMLDLVRAASTRGDLSELEAAGDDGKQLASGVRKLQKVQAGEVGTREELAKLFGMEGAALEEFGLAEGKISVKEATRVAEQLAAGGVLAQATSRTAGVQFQGGMDPEVIALTTAQQVQQNAELISLVHSQVTGKDPVVPKPFAAPMKKEPTFGGPRGT